MTNTISILSNEQLLKELHDLAKTERECTLALLVHLAEFDRRQYFLELGIPSLFEYCRRRLHYSESGAQRRIAAARLIQHFPQVYQMFKDSELSLSVITELAKVLTVENSSELLQLASGKSKREVERIVAQRGKAATKGGASPIIPLVAALPRCRGLLV